jgi:hypothetical protein
MAGRNGVAMRPPMRFSVIPKSVPFEIERANPDDPNGEPVVVTLRAWQKSLPHPEQIDIAVEGVIDVYREAIWAEEQRRNAQPGAVLLSGLTRAQHEMHAGILDAVIEGLEPGEAEILAVDGGPWQEILIALGWWKLAEPAAPSDGKEDADDPEAPGEEPVTISNGFSPGSAQPIQEPTSSP